MTDGITRLLKNYADKTDNTGSGRYPYWYWPPQVEGLGAGEILLTSTDRDVTCDGYYIPITMAVSDAINIPVIASGRATGPEHIFDAFVNEHVDAALAASIFHFGEYSVGDVKGYLMEKTVSVRIVESG